MVLNPDKCSFMLLDVNDDLKTDLIWEMKHLKIVNKKQVLDATSDNKLNFAAHLVNITKNDGGKFNALARVQKYMTTEQKLIFSSYIKSQFCFSSFIESHFFAVVH